MARDNKIWFWNARGEWYVNIGTVRHRLGPDKDEAERAFHEMKAKRPEKPLPGTVGELFQSFLDWCTKTKKEPSTREWYKDHLQSFLDFLPGQNLPLALLKKKHVYDWVDSHPKWGDAARRGAMTAVCRAFNWAEKEDHIERNPVRGIEKPAQTVREVVISPVEYRKLLKHLRGPFRDLVVTAWETGARPQEILRVRAEWVELKQSRWVFPLKKSKGKKRRRVVYLTPAALEITKRLMKANPEGPIFLNNDGESWTAFSISNSFTRLKKKVGKKYNLVSFRHSFVTNGLKKGIDPVTMQHLCGHADLSMISKVYGHVSQDVRHMQRALSRK